MNGRISSIYTGSAVDGPGIRTVVFFQGCPLRCAYCHNPETHDINGGDLFSADELFERIKKYKSYYGKKGGVTFSGGEALMQGEFLLEMLRLCKSDGINTAIDTSGAVIDECTLDILSLCDIVILDIKMDNEQEYKEYIKGSFEKTMEFLRICEKLNKYVIIRRVIVPGINDNQNSIEKLNCITSEFSCIKKTELLPFEKLCSEKYDKLGMEFPMKDFPAMDRNRLENLSECLKKR